MTPSRRLLAPLTAAVLLAGCAQIVTNESLLACAMGDEGAPANGVILMAQSVRSATYVPCLENMPLGWHVAGVEADDDSAAFWLDSDRDGVRALEIRLVGGCDTADATEIPSDRPEMRRFERVSQVAPQYVGRRSYVFEGGCIEVLFRLAGHDRTEPLAVATQAIGAVPREELRDHVRRETGGRLELDPVSIP